MKRAKQLYLLISAVAGLLALAALHDWWDNQYDTENSYGIRKLSAITATNITTERKSVTPLLTTTTTKRTSTAKILQPSKAYIVPTIQKTVTIRKKVTVVGRATRRFNSTSVRVRGSLFNLNSNASRILVANAMLKSRPLKVIEKEKVIRILLVTYFRGGSTFLGDLLQQNWKTFYHFEPLHYASFASRVTTKNHIKDAFNVMSHLFRCNFDPLTYYIEWAKLKKHQFLIKRNQFLWALCHIHPSICFTPYYMKQICLRAPVQVMKVTRIYLREAIEFVKQNRELKIKLIYLSRDPRGIFSSRRVLSWCKKDRSCGSPESVCKDMSSDIKYLRNNLKSFIWMRYEDLCLNSENLTRSLYKWLGVPYTIGVANFLRSHTKAQKIHADNPYSTRRNTSTVAFEWLHRLPFPEMDHVQSKCSDVMTTLGYKTIGNGANITRFENEIPGSVLDATPQTDGVSVFRN